MPTRCLQAQKKPHRETRKDMTQRTSQKGEKQNHARAKSVEAANRGWMSEKYLPPADQVKCFFLTSPFIEPAAPDLTVFEFQPPLAIHGATCPLGCWKGKA